MTWPHDKPSFVVLAKCIPNLFSLLFFLGGGGFPCSFASQWVPCPFELFSLLLQLCEGSRQSLASWFFPTLSHKSDWWVPNIPGVAERAPWRSSQSGCGSGQQPIRKRLQIPVISRAHMTTLVRPQLVTRTQGSFSWVSTRSRSVGRWRVGAIFACMFLCVYVCVCVCVCVCLCVCVSPPLPPLDHPSPVQKSRIPPADIPCQHLDPQAIVGLPRKQKIAVNKFWVRESEIGEECRQFWKWILGVNFLGGLKPWKKQGRKIRYQNSPSKFAIKIRRQFSQNSPDQNKKFTPNPLCITSGPTIVGPTPGRTTL